MKQKDKELLFKDLCARLPYGCFYKAKRKLTTWNRLLLSATTIDHISQDLFDDIKPYLRPMSSMTEEEWETLRLLKGKLVECDENNDEKFYGIINEIHTFYYSCHIDCNGLIDKGLALEAPEGMYK